MNADDYLKNSKAYVWKESFAITKASKPDPNAFINIVDKHETTVIIDQSKLNKSLTIEKELDFKLITLDIILPMNATGIIAKISGALAKDEISIISIATYSRDHFLIKETDLAKAIISLKRLGITI
ncbi:hypothetical protein CL622_02320 [archaeon]|nr:hypothetical protein [archaeon]|tara:strand:+ start:1055 stop:1432 length:378 start_codon:yes stop_codon:yes gene_type:complete